MSNSGMTPLFVLSACTYRIYKTRKQLAAIDWNYHLKLEEATTKGSDLIVTRKYNQRTKEWKSKVIKVKEKYKYISMLMVKIMHAGKEVYRHGHQAGLTK